MDIIQFKEKNVSSVLENYGAVKFDVLLMLLFHLWTKAMCVFKHDFLSNFPSQNIYWNCFFSSWSFIMYRFKYIHICLLGWGYSSKILSPPRPRISGKIRDKPRNSYDHFALPIPFGDIGLHSNTPTYLIEYHILQKSILYYQKLYPAPFLDFLGHICM